MSSSIAVLDAVPSVVSCGYNTCETCTISDIDFITFSNNEHELMTFFFTHGVLSCHALCSKCGGRVVLKHYQNRYIYRCARRISHRKQKKATCNHQTNALHGTFFHNTHLPLRTVALLVGIYLSRSTSRQMYACRELGLCSKTVVDWFSFIREVIVHYVERNSQKIGGIGKVVEIDEAKFGRRKYNRGRLLKGRWVLGGIEREADENGIRGMFLVGVPDRTADTLLNIIKQYVRPGTTIMTDCWKAYDGLTQENFKHLSVNHSINFVDPLTSAHTQNIERSWVEVRRHVPRAGLVDTHLDTYLADSIFRRHLPDHRLRRHVFWQTVAQLYPPEDHPLA